MRVPSSSINSTSTPAPRGPRTPLHRGHDLHNPSERFLTVAGAVNPGGTARTSDSTTSATRVACLVAGGAPLPHIQARLGHESITTTIDIYGHLLPAGDELISGIIDTAPTGGTIRPNGGR